MKKKKSTFRHLGSMALLLVLSVALGYGIGAYVGSLGAESFGEVLLSLGVTLLLLYAALVVQTVLHEGGHLLGGLLTGYGFCSFRILSYMWVKEADGLHLKRFRLPGTMGQCLMSPPDLVAGKLPVTLYNLGGPLANLLAALVFGGLYLLCRDIAVLREALLLLTVSGLFLGLTNGIPLHAGNVDNDGMNALSLGKNPAALRAFWIQMKVNELNARGIRLKDMPPDWFRVPEEKELKNSMLATLGVLACNRLMDQHRFAEADALMEQLLELDTGILGIHRHLMQLDRLYCELLDQNRPDVAAQYLNKEQKKFMKSMKEYPAILRAAYTYAQLGIRDLDQAEAILLRFERMSQKYPYPSEIQSERELMELAEQASHQRSPMLHQ